VTAARTIAGLSERIEIAELRPPATYREIHLACLQAQRYGLGAVVVHPVHCRRAAGFLRGTRVRLVAVVGFPSGAFTIPGKSFEARDAIAQGAQEIDYVVNVGALLADDEALVSREMEAIRRATRGHVLKATLENSVLRDEQKASACHLAADVGIDFVETSTGLAPDGLSVEDVRLMHREAAGRLRVGAAGPIESVLQAEALIAAGASRLRTPFMPFIAGSEHEPA
jgi:deoxyribose-phosphate aldolase